MELAPFGSIDPAALRWLRTREVPAAFTLSAGDRAVATLDWQRAGGSLAVARTATESWTLKRAGFLQPTIVVRREGKERPIAQLTAHLTRHEISLTGGGVFRLRHVSHVVPAWRVTTDAGAELLHVEPVAERRALSGGAVLVAAAAGASPSTLLLAVISWYFVVLSWFEDEAIDALASVPGPEARAAAGPGAVGRDA